MSGPQFPLPANEPEVHFGKGTAAAAELNRALETREVVEIPTVIGGKRYFSNDVVEVRAPHDTQRLLARIHRPTQAQVSEAIESSKVVARDWASLTHASRATVLHRAADI